MPKLDEDFDTNKMNSHTITAGLRPALVVTAPLGLGGIPTIRINQKPQRGAVRQHRSQACAKQHSFSHSDGFKTHRYIIIKV